MQFRDNSITFNQQSHITTLLNTNMNKQSIEAIIERRKQQYQQAFEQILQSSNQIAQKMIPDLLKQQLAIQTYINLTENKSNDKFKEIKDAYLNKYNDVISISNKTASAVTQFQNQINNALKSDLQMQLSNYGSNNLFMNIINKQHYDIYVSNRTEISRLMQELANEKNRANTVTKQYQQLQNLHATVVGQYSSEQSRLQESLSHQRAHLTGEIQKHKDQCVILQKEIQKLTNEVNQLTRQSANQQQSISNLQYNAEILRREKETISDDYAKLKGADKRDEISAAEKHSKQLQELAIEAQDLRVKILALETQNKRQQVELDTKQQEHCHLVDKIKAMNHKIEQLKEQHVQDLENMRKELQQEQQMLQLREGTKEHLLQQLKHLQEENSELLLKNNNLKTEHRENKLILDDFIARNKHLQVENEKITFQNKNLLETLTLQKNGVQKAEFLNKIQALQLDNSALKQQLLRSRNAETHEKNRRHEFEEKYKVLDDKFQSQNQKCQSLTQKLDSLSYKYKILSELSAKCENCKQCEVFKEDYEVQTQKRDFSTEKCVTLGQEDEKSIQNFESSQLSSRTSSRGQSSRSQSTKSNRKKKVRSPWMSRVTTSQIDKSTLKLSKSARNLDIESDNSQLQSSKPTTGLRKSENQSFQEKKSRISTAESGYQQLSINQIQQQQAGIPIIGDFFNIHNRNRLIFSANQCKMKKNQGLNRGSSHQEFKKKNSQHVDANILSDIVVK